MDFFSRLPLQTQKGGLLFGITFENSRSRLLFKVNAVNIENEQEYYAHFPQRNMLNIK